MDFTTHSTRVIIIIFSLMLSACGRVSLSITDAPVDGVDEVNLAIKSVVFEADDGETTEVDYSPVLLIDLLTLTNGVTEQLVSSESLNQGNYRSVSLKLDIEASSVVVDGTDFSITMPTDAESGLKANKDFEVKTSNDVNLVIDFDLRKSLHPVDNSNYVLRPSVRLVVESETGSVTGNIASSLLSSDSQCFDNAGAVTAVVYVFSGKDTAVNDIAGASTDPLSSARVDGDFNYTAAFLESGDYTLSLTCEAINDDPSVDDTIAFLATHNVVVEKAQSVTQNF